ncbi:hypothetical protein [Kibdelosporangium aridum]|uniref:hypothetical protein n=1 Tax=Kibdelosporangium aridum TaxID=2030 RepID=UPI0005267628
MSSSTSGEAELGGHREQATRETGHAVAGVISNFNYDRLRQAVAGEYQAESDAALFGEEP